PAFPISFAYPLKPRRAIIALKILNINGVLIPHYSLGDSLNWKRRVLKEQQKRLTSVPYSLGDSIDWKRSILKERAKRLAASNR
ncbi:MAG: hypothetical protein WCP16_07855, partial [Pseudanabaena sp. ELA645]